MQNFFDEDSTETIKNLKNATKGGGMWMRMEHDGDHYFCVLLENPQQYKHVFEKDGKKDVNTRAKANFAIFEKDEKTGEYEFNRLAIWDNVSPAKFASVVEDIQEHGKAHLFKLVRKGAKGYKDTQYKPYPQRPLTQEEKTTFHNTELLPLEKQVSDDEAIDGAKEEVAKQIQRLGWTMEQYEVANVKHFGEKRETKDMMVNDRVLFIAALVKMAVGADPTTINSDSGTLDLDEDADFFE